MQLTKRRLAVAYFSAIAVTLVGLPTPAEATFPGWNGYLAFVRNGDIWMYTPDGQKGTNLTNNASVQYESAPAWAPDGTRLAFVEDSWGGGIDVMTVDDYGIRTPVGDPAFVYDNPAWSPDGTRIAVDVQPEKGGGTSEGTRIGIIDLDTSTTSMIDTSPHECPVKGDQNTEIRGCDLLSESEPSWSPDGKWIAFTRRYEVVISWCGGWVGCHGDEYVTNRVTVIAADGSGARFLAQGFRPDWSPDGTQIAFNCNNMWFEGKWRSGVCVIDASGGKPWMAAVDGRDGVWSPDGLQLAFERRNCCNADLFIAAFGDDPYGGDKVVGHGYLVDWQPILNVVDCGQRQLLEKLRRHIDGDRLGLIQVELASAAIDRSRKAAEPVLREVHRQAAPVTQPTLPAVTRAAC